MRYGGDGSSWGKGRGRTLAELRTPGRDGTLRTQPGYTGTASQPRSARCCEAPPCLLLPPELLCENPRAAMPAAGVEGVSDVVRGRPGRLGKQKGSTSLRPTNTELPGTQHWLVGTVGPEPNRTSQTSGSPLAPGPARCPVGQGRQRCLAGCRGRSSPAPRTCSRWEGPLFIPTLPEPEAGTTEQVLEAPMLIG